MSLKASVTYGAKRSVDYQSENVSVTLESEIANPLDAQQEVASLFVQARQAVAAQVASHAPPSAPRPQTAPQAPPQAPQPPYQAPPQRTPQFPPGAVGQLCPLCGLPMKQRASNRGPFWGCSSYPKCKGIVTIQ